jgi:hypothetical protein
VNLNEYIISNALADAEPSVIAAGYIKEALALADADEQLAALEPSVRQHASALASRLRRAFRSGPAQNRRDSQTPDGGPDDGYGSQGADGGPAQVGHDDHGTRGGPAVIPAWARDSATLIAYCKDHWYDWYYIPGEGRRRLHEITAGQWQARARWLRQIAAGTTLAADRSAAFAALVEAAGAATIGDALGSLGREGASA